jgi:hypothetical protein
MVEETPVPEVFDVESAAWLDCLSPTRNLRNTGGKTSLHAE